MGPWWMWAGWAAAAPEAFVLSGATLPDGRVAAVEVREGRITAIGEVDPALPAVELEGRWLQPGVVDSHVHLAVWPVGDRLADAGVALAIDLAAPLSSLTRPTAGPGIRWAGPMITAPGGYPTQSWGRDGYGLPVASAEAAVVAVDQLHEAGARLVKVPVGGDPALSDDTLRAIVERAHHHGLPVVAHTLTDAGAAAAAAAGVDALAHTPTEPLSDATVSAWADGVVISTLTAFGASAATLDNLRRLRAAGAVVLYGTDLGNTRTPAIDPDELSALQAAGLDGAAITEALTTAPAAFWGFEGGRLAVGAPASVVVLSADPARDPSAWASPERVFLDGVER